jgi:hypothetical protein
MLARIRRLSILLAGVVLLTGPATASAQETKPKVARSAAVSSAPAKPRSTYTGKAKLEKGFVVLPDGRKIAVPANVKAKLPGAGKLNEWPETTGQADEGMQEVGAVADEMIAEEVSKREQLQRVNQLALRGVVIKPGPAAKQRNPHHRSEYTGKAKIKNGFVVLPDGRQFAVPADIKAKWPGFSKGDEWIDAGGDDPNDEDGQDDGGPVASEGGWEVQAAGDEIYVEAGGDKLKLQANPEALRGTVIRAAPRAQQPAQTPATQPASQPTKAKLAK